MGIMNFCGKDSLRSFTYIVLKIGSWSQMNRQRTRIKGRDLEIWSLRFTRRSYDLDHDEHRSGHDKVHTRDPTVVVKWTLGQFLRVKVRGGSELTWS